MTWPAAIAVCLVLFAYLRSPIDLLPDRLGGVGLLDDLAMIVIAIVWMRRRVVRARSARPSDPAPENTAWDPHAVLGVQPGASAEEITRAYREQMRRYHPDHVAHLGDELQQLAHEKTLDIQRAYAEIGRP
jgi:preprotein translocase subunit Sec63